MALRLAYVVPEAVTPTSGVGRKITDQANTWVELGAEVAVFVLTRNSTSPSQWSTATFAVHTEIWRRGRSAVGTELLRQSALWRLTTRHLGWRPTATYLRFAPYFFAAERLLAHGPVALEVNSDDTVEYRPRGRALVAYNRLTRSRMLRGAEGVVYPTYELLQRNGPGRSRQKLTVIGNGIDLAGVAPIPAPRNDRPNLIMTASSGSPWQGIDKICRLAALAPQYEFHVAGVKRTSPMENLHFHGFLQGADYLSLLGGADVALGSLALHRAGLEEACPLKVRRYLASGIPTVITHHDTDLDDRLPFLLRIPNTETNVVTHVEEIVAFVERMVGVRVPRGSLACIDQRPKEVRRLAFIRGLVEGS